MNQLSNNTPTNFSRLNGQPFDVLKVSVTDTVSLFVKFKGAAAVDEKPCFVRGDLCH